MTWGLRWIWSGLVLAALLYTGAIAAVFNAVASFGHAAANRIPYGLETFNSLAWQSAGIAGASAVALAVSKKLRLHGVAMPLLWALLAMSCFAAFSAYMYPRNGALMKYNEWATSGMLDPPDPWEARFWRPLFHPYERP